jgi:hypothetical protein
MAKHDIIIGIDPDCEKSGVATLKVVEKRLIIESLDFPRLLEHLAFGKKMADDHDLKVIVIVEAGWLNESNWHVNPKDSKAMASAKGNAVGRNHETGRKIVEMAKHYGLEVQEVRPLKKIWASQDGKISHDEISQFIPSFPKRSNQEARDAALIAWNYAGFPIVVKPVKK